ncbi:MAG: SDR family oxidoreductase [Bacteroidota bacterium]
METTERNHPFSLAGKTAIVTGGASGIGLAISRLFARRGSHVLLFDRNEAAAQQVTDELRAEGLRATPVLCDVSSKASVQDAFQYLPGGELDILVNNAGVAHVGSIEQTEVEDLDRIYDINIKGIFNCAKEAVVLMKERGGVILNVASVAAVLGLADRFAYSMSKGAALTMTYSIAKDYVQYGIRCNAMAPARIHTPFVDGFLAKNYPGQEQEMFGKLSATQPIGRMGTPDEVAAMALYLCSDEASFLTGTCYPIDGGFITLNS